MKEGTDFEVKTTKNKDGDVVKATIVMKKGGKKKVEDNPKEDA